MVRCLQVILVFCLVACATAPGIVQDKPKPDQCFEGPFSIYRLNSEPWKPIAADPPVFFLRNPRVGEHPAVIVAIIVPPGQILRYGYVDGQKFRSFIYSAEKDCYVEEILDPAVAEEGKKILLKLAKEMHCEI